ncbi:uncharacterized protein BYT42DRAFT_467034, partial [Radiomyces spectabilis]|uniref:uncharacterized protein n=1 Tax=Radiomyces spectabilis TaxID=64574 RepID=UPI0022210237
CLSSVITYKHQPDTPRIAILNRGRTRHITNIPEVIDALSAMNVSIETIDFDAGCNMRSTAELVKDVDVLIAPFGNGLGAGLFMKKDAVLISIASRWYNEDWFKWPMTAVGRRIYNFECRNAICQEYDRSFLTSILDQYNLKLNETEIQALLTQEYPIELLSKYIPGREREMIEQYYKDVRRRIDVKSFIPFLKDIL